MKRMATSLLIIVQEVFSFLVKRMAATLQIAIEEDGHHSPLSKSPLMRIATTFHISIESIEEDGVHSPDLYWRGGTPFTKSLLRWMDTTLQTPVEESSHHSLQSFLRRMATTLQVSIKKDVYHSPDFK